ncbi:hypothetical protein HO173_004388 [Letharia columbiana]|uniref:Uncharacterized protein n=1 Tax=Letharia columbiana TaxID=112416 RepID=A0A8H6L6Q2_9LECA|nr:uncharacterized protein HO173_004388 [Letharia columbiana]KAF6237498.1 hypothetical protein HO173_004388 [Letharia columbiana]
MKATASQELKRVSPRTNKGIFTSTKLDQEQTPLPRKSSKSKSQGKAGKKAPPTKTAPKAIQKATAPKNAAPSPPPHRSRAARAADRAAPARAAAVRKSVKLAGSRPSSAGSDEGDARESDWRSGTLGMVEIRAGRWARGWGEARDPRTVVDGYVGLFPAVVVIWDFR